MSSVRPRRLQLEPPSYEGLRQQVLRRDGWRCQGCGSISNLEVHIGNFVATPEMIPREI
jgi:hypothetical protein